MNFNEALQGLVEHRYTTGVAIARLFQGIGVEPQPRMTNEIVELIDAPEVAIVAARLAALVDFTGRTSTEWVVDALSLLDSVRELNGEPPTWEMRHFARVLGLGASLAADMIRLGVLRPLRPVEPCELSRQEIMAAIVGD